MLCGDKFSSLDQAVRSLVRRFVDAFTHRKSSHGSRVVGHEYVRQPSRRRGWSIEPYGVVFGPENHRHPVGYVSQQFIRRGCQDRARLYDLTCTRFPSVPDSGEGEQRIIVHSKMEWLLELADSPPFVKSVSRDQTAPSLKALPERWLFKNGLASGVDLRCRWVLRP